MSRYWESKELSEMSREEWESLCDGCAKCCLHKLEDEDSGEVVYTKISCRYLNNDDCRCTEYENRNTLVPNCVWLKPEDVNEFHWLPSTCAYRLVSESKPLPDWHHLISGSRETIHQQGISVKGRTLNETYVHPDGMDEHIINWVE